MAAAIPFWKPWIRILLSVLLLAILVDYKLRVNATVCILGKEHLAYEAVAKDAHAENKNPHVLIIPLWPGDSTWASLYEYYSSLYRIRMVNGYSPVISKKYHEDIFLRLCSLNQGFASDAQLDFLLAHGVRHLLLHEEAFPYKVSPFPVGFTLKQYLEHPRLSFLKQDRTVWAFQILKQGEEKPLKTSQEQQFLNGWKTFFPSHPQRLSPEKDSAGMKTKALAMGMAPHLRWLIRLRGEGTLHVAIGSGKEFWKKEPWVISEKDWTWKTLDMEGWNTHAPTWFYAEPVSGKVDLDLCMMVAGEWNLSPSGVTTIPAPVFFHNGFTCLERNSVIFKKDQVCLNLRPRDPVVFYGPSLPLEKGAYTVSWDFSTDAPLGTAIAKVQIKSGEEILISKELISGEPFQCAFQTQTNLPLSCEFTFSNTGNVELLDWKLEPGTFSEK
jgi:hypothetical protein